MKSILKPFASILTAGCVTISGTSALALDISQIPGQVTAMSTPSGKAEVCVTANRMMPEAYKEKDNKDEAELCGYNFYSSMAMCPKLNSTNPGVLITDLLKGKTREQTMSVCKAEGNLSVEAKFKNSISCSYTPSILAYYHFSRMLKAGNVPAAVLRTMDKQEHLKIVGKALDILKNQQDEVIYKTWKSFSGAHAAGTSFDLFDSTGKFVYGALVDNPKKEYRYKEVSGSGVYDTRYERFLVQPPYLKVSNPANLSVIADLSNHQKSLPVVVQMKDVTDMILLDTLFSQQDRIGNIHYKWAWYTAATDPETGKKGFKKDNSKTELSSDGKSWVVPENEKAIQATGAQLVKEILMKDNDCGVNVNQRTNMMRKISALEGVRHMSARTYKKFMELYKVAKTPAFISWMKNELLFTNADIGKVGAPGFISNLERAYLILNTNCKNGTLKLDLNIDDLIPGNPVTQAKCDI